MNKDSYFSHNSTAHRDPKLESLLMKWKLEGFGLYWLILERMWMTDDVALPYEPFIFESLSMFHSGDETMVQQCIDFCIERKLFTMDPDTGTFYSKSLRERKQMVIDISKKRRRAGRVSAEKRGFNVEIPNDDVEKPTHVEHPSTNRNKKKKTENVNGKDKRERLTVVEQMVDNERRTPEGLIISYEQPMLFEQTIYNEFDKFEECFAGTDYENINLKYYHEVVKNWSANKKVFHENWIGVTKKIILKDIQDGKVVSKDNNPNRPNKKTVRNYDIGDFSDED